MGSAKTVYVPDCEMAFNPDALVMKGESLLFPRKRKVAGIINPYILVEIHSDSTEEFDMKKKLPCYKNWIPFIKLFILNKTNLTLRFTPKIKVITTGLMMILMT